MDYEVEQKHRVKDRAVLEQKLRAIHAELEDAVVQVDEYFAHPTRDFSATDEALRVRRVGPKNWVTYKGPKIDQTTKTRQEIELALPSGEQGAAQFCQLLQVLGFTPVTTVRKQRRHATLRWQGRPCEVALDEVDRVGTFVELEFSATDNDLDAARASLQSLASHLQLGKGERRSYLELLLQATSETD